ncbi:MAG: TolC family protein [Bacteroidia bacterium]|nr:TolC family protein [Bacteroidia bacterium]
MIKIKKYTALFVISLVTIHANAQESKSNSFSLQQAVEYGLKNSPNMLNADLDKQNAIYRKNEILGLGLPQLNGSVDGKYFMDIPYSVVKASAFNPFAPADQLQALQFGLKWNASVGMSASQLIFSSDYLFGLKASKEFVGLYEINLKRTKTDIAQQISKAYYMVLVNTERLKLFDANLTRLKKAFDDLSAYNKQGFVEQIEVERLEVQMNNLMNEKNKTENLVGLTKTALKFQMGFKLSDEIELTDKLDTEQDQNQEMTLASINVKSRPDYQVLQSQQTLLDLDVKRLKYGYMPTLAAYGSFQLNAMRPKFNFFEFDQKDLRTRWFSTNLIGLTLNVNIFDGLQRHYKIQQAKVASQKSLNTLKNVEQAAELEANSAVVSYNNALVSMKIQKKNMDLAQHILEVSNKKFAAGVGSNLEIVNAEASLKESQINYYNAVYDLLSAKIDYQKATGTLVK